MGKGRENVIKREYFFPLDNYPDNYRQVVGKDLDLTKQENLRVGVTTYSNFYSDAEIKEMERMIEHTEQLSLEERYLPMTA